MTSSEIRPNRISRHGWPQRIPSLLLISVQSLWWLSNYAGGFRGVWGLSGCMDVQRDLNPSVEIGEVGLK